MNGTPLRGRSGPQSAGRGNASGARLCRRQGTELWHLSFRGHINHDYGGTREQEHTTQRPAPGDGGYPREWT